MVPTQQNRASYEFDDFSVDSVDRVLLRQGERVPLTPKVFDLLLMLIENHGHVVGKDRLMSAVWPDSFVEEGNLTQNISVLRKVLNAGAPGHEYIQTIPRRGYRFVGNVRQARNGEIELVVQEHSTARVVIEEADPAKQVRKTSTTLAWVRSHMMAMTALVIVLAVTLGMVWFRFRPRRSTNARVFSFDNYSWQNLSSDNNTGGMISPDGEFLVYLSRTGVRTWSVKQRRLSSEETLSILPEMPAPWWGAALTHDSSFLYYLLPDENRETGTLFKISVLGGTPRKILEHANGGPTLSPDDSRVAFIRYGFKPGVSALITANARDGSDERVLEESDQGPELFSPAWSPDGQRILCTKVDKRPDGNYWSLVEVPATGGPIKQFGAATSQHLWWPGWLPDGSAIIMIATDPASARHQVYLISYPDGSVKRMTNDLYNYLGISISTDQTKLVTNHEERQAAVWIADLDTTKPIKTSACCADRVSWTPDGRIVYDVSIRGTRHVWIMDAAGGNQRQLSPENAVDWNPSVSPDGRTIVFLSTRSGRTEIWRSDSDGRKARRLTERGPDLWQPQIAPDGQTVYFSHYSMGRWVLERVSINGGEPEQVAEVAADLWSISPDGTKIAYSFFDQKLNRWQLAVRALEANSAVTQFDNAAFDVLTWTPDGKSLIYKDVSGRDPNIGLWRQPLSGEKPQPFIAGAPETDYWLDWSPDGKKFAFVRGHQVMNMVMMTRNDKIAQLARR